MLDWKSEHFWDFALSQVRCVNLEVVVTSRGLSFLLMMMTATVSFIEYFFWVVTHPKCSHLLQKWHDCPHFSDEIMLVLRGKWFDQGFTGKAAEPANKPELSDVKAPCSLYARCCHSLTNTTANDASLIGYLALCKRKWVNSWESPFKSKITQQLWSTDLSH